MIPILILNEIKSDDYSIVTIKLKTTIDNKYNLRKFKFKILCKNSKITNLRKINNKLSIDLNTFIITINNKRIPSFICPIPMDIELTGLKYVINSDLISFKWKKILNNVYKYNSIDNILN